MQARAEGVKCGTRRPLRARKGGKEDPGQGSQPGGKARFSWSDVVTSIGIGSPWAQGRLGVGVACLFLHPLGAPYFGKNTQSPELDFGGLMAVRRRGHNYRWLLPTPKGRLASKPGSARTNEDLRNYTTTAARCCCRKSLAFDGLVTTAAVNDFVYCTFFSLLSSSLLVFSSVFFVYFWDIFFKRAWHDSRAFFLPFFFAKFVLHFWLLSGTFVVQSRVKLKKFFSYCSIFKSGGD